MAIVPFQMMTLGRKASYRREEAEVNGQSQNVSAWKSWIAAEGL